MVSKSNNIHHKPTRQVGFVLKPHGYSGQFRINLDDDFELKDFLLIEINSKFVPFAIQSYNPDSGLVKLKDFNSIDDIQELMNLPILEVIDQVESEADTLVGYTLVDTISGLNFQITNIVEFPGNTLLEFRHEFKDVLLPFNPHIIIEIEHETKIIKAEFPDGILDL